VTRSAFFTPATKQDLGLARDWYECEREGLGFEFIDEVLKATNRIQSDAEHFSPVYRETRICPIKRFPYLIIFRLVENTPEILAVLHGHRDPQV
jgi:plasmid stabilization system protein ParE